MCAGRQGVGCTGKRSQLYQRFDGGVNDEKASFFVACQGLGGV